MRGRRWGGAGVWGIVAVLVVVSCGRSTAPDGDDGAFCSSNVDCAEEEVCKGGTCLPIPIAEGGAGPGEGGTPPASAGYPAASGGAPFFGEAGQGSGGVGGAGGSGGEPASCEPAQKSCDGPTVRVCESDGRGMLILETCARSQVCRDGACRDIVCVPNTQFCAENAAYQCDEDGAGSSEVEPCVAGSYCSEQDGKASCGATKCQPGGALCSGGVATTCAADGSGPKPGGTDCSSSNQVCLDGQCQGKLCTAGERVCQHDDVYVCSPNGASLELFADCTANEACDVELASCRPRLCEPGKLGCDSDRVVSCNALGTGWVQSGTDCAKDDALCVAGSCKPVVCTPNARFCQDGNVYSCDDLGIKATLTDDCTPGTEHCQPSGGTYAYCASNYCTPNAPVCTYDDVLTTCNAEGSGALPGGSDCKPDGLCRNGSCKPKLCDSYSYFCKDGDVQRCGDGTSYELYDDCGSQAKCRTGDGYAHCEPYPCEPGSTGCFGNVIGKCAEDGESISEVAEDCGGSAEVCSLAGECSASVIDTLGAQEDLLSQYDGSFVADVVEVYSDRTLTEIQANLVLAAPRKLSFAVYEYKPYSYQARLAEKVVVDQSGSGYFSSGGMSLALKTGKRYLFVVSAAGGGFVPYLDVTPWEPKISFGRALGSISGTYGASLYTYSYDAGRVFDLKLTTSAP